MYEEEPLDHYEEEPDEPDRDIYRDCYCCGKPIDPADNCPFCENPT